MASKPSPEYSFLGDVFAGYAVVKFVDGASSNNANELAVLSQ